MQVLNHAYFEGELHSKNNYIEVFKPARGRIFDRNGNILACDQREFEVHLLPIELKNEDLLITVLYRLSVTLSADFEELKKKVLSRVDAINAKWADKPERERKRLVERDMNTPFKLFEHRPFESIVPIDTSPEDFPGVIVRETTRRVYPYGSAASHILGFVSPLYKGEYEQLLESGYFRRHFAEGIEDEEFEYIQNVWGFMDETVGRKGMESYYDEYLKGKRGAMHIQKEIYHKTKKIVKEIPAEHGADIYLSIDIELQKRAERALSGKKGAIVIIDVQNGEILAMASCPDFDPNMLISPVTREYNEYVNFNPETPMMNRAIESAYPLGSIFKIATSFAALEEGKISVGTEFTCNGYLFPEKKKMGCWIAKRGEGLGHGPLDVVGGLMHSCNVFFYNAGAKAGIDALYKWGYTLGFGRKTGIDLFGEVEGIMPSREWKREYAKKVRGLDPVWRDADSWNLGIGQGFLSVTPIQVAEMMSAIANDGNLVTPHLLITAEPMQKYKIPLTHPQALETIRKGLYAVVNEPGGTAYATDLKNLDCCGKTSTAQVVSNENLAQLDQYKDHAWFSGYAPIKKPKVAFVVLIEHGGSGGQAAAPVAVEILRAYNDLTKNEK